MDKIIGKIFTVLTVILWSTAGNARVNLSVLDVKGAPLMQAQAGRPFTIEVAVSEQNRDGRDVEVTGLDAFSVHHKGLMMSSINGVSSFKQTYQVTANNPGTYIIGPARVHGEESNVIELVVGVQQKVEPTATTQQDDVQSTDAFVHIQPSKQRVVVGEKLTLSMRFYYRTNTVQLQRVTPPTLTAFDAGKQTGPLRGQETIKGVPYHYSEWILEYYPKEVGAQVIPAYAADYSVPAEQRNRGAHDFLGFVDFFGPRHEAKKSYSNSVTITVDPLPDNDTPVHAVGVFSGVAAQLQTAVAKEGEGVVYTLSLQGTEDVERVKPPALTMPDSLRHYDSKSSVITPTTPGNPYIKKFEYIVQGIKAGDWEIPAQSFTYFDTTTRTYNTLRAPALKLKVVPGQMAQPAPVVIAPEQEATAQETPVDMLEPLNTTGVWYAVSERIFPWWWFFVIACLPLIAFLMFGLVAFAQWYRSKYAYKTRARNAFAHARREIKECKDKQQYGQLYHIFVELIAVRCKVPSTDVTQEFIMQRLQDAGLPAEQCEKWDSFFAVVAEQKFFGKQALVASDLGRQALGWVDILEQRL